jgi:predicted negative regulator of RcsB-dependent stress response
LKAKKDQASAEAELKRVADSGTTVAPLAKIALAQIYIGEKKTSAAQDLLRSIINSPTELVSKAQAQILLAQSEASVNPQGSKGELKMISPEDQKRPAVSKAADAVSAQLK